MTKIYFTKSTYGNDFNDFAQLIVLGILINENSLFVQFDNKYGVNLNII